MERGRRRRRAILGAAQDDSEFVSGATSEEQSLSESSRQEDPWAPSEPFVSNSEAGSGEPVQAEEKGGLQRWLGLSSLKNTDDLQFAEINETLFKNNS